MAGRRSLQIEWYARYKSSGTWVSRVNRDFVSMLVTRMHDIERGEHCQESRDIHVVSVRDSGTDSTTFTTFDE